MTADFQATDATTASAEPLSVESDAHTPEKSEMDATVMPSSGSPKSSGSSSASCASPENVSSVTEVASPSTANDGEGIANATTSSSPVHENETGKQEEVVTTDRNLAATAASESAGTMTTGTPSGSAAQSPADAVATAAAQDGTCEPVRRNKIEVKLFIGRLPRTIDEATLTTLFSSFGSVAETVIIRDKASGQHKGSAFIKMASITEADAAIRALHNSKVIDPQLGPILVKYANGEPERLGLSSTDSSQPGNDVGKLFVGSLTRSLGEQEVRRMFEPYGRIDEVVLMKDPGTSQSRGCAFVKYAFKEDAINAIKAMHGIVTMPGSSRPLEVKFAESRRAAASASAATNAIVGSGAAGQQASTGMHPGVVGVTGTPAAGWVTGGATAPVAGWMTANVVAPSNLNPRSAGGWTEYFTADNRAYYHSEATGLTQWTKPPEFDRLCAATTMASSVMGGAAGIPGSGGGILLPPTNTTTGGGSGTSDVAGPPGANVFVFHIPNEWTQNDVAAHFSHFGPVISCYIATDRATGRNKGYGFVSYDNIQSAANAVLGMNGYLVGSKRLKVSIKTGEESHVAHLLGPSAAGSLPATAHHHSHQAHAYAQAAQAHQHLGASVHHHGASHTVSHHVQSLGPTASALGPPPPLQGYHPHHTAVHHHHHHHPGATHHGGHAVTSATVSPTTGYGPIATSTSTNALNAYRASPY